MTITATVTDEFGQPAPSAQVYWVQEGPMEFTYFETETDQYGVAIARIIGYDDGEATITAQALGVSSNDVVDFQAVAPGTVVVFINPSGSWTAVRGTAFQNIRGTYTSGQVGNGPYSVEVEWRHNTSGGMNKGSVGTAGPYNGESVVQWGPFDWSVPTSTPTGSTFAMWAWLKGTLGRQSPPGKVGPGGVS